MKKQFLKLMFIAFFASIIFVPIYSVNATTKKPVVKAYDYELVDQQPSEIITMQPGEIRTVWIEVKNTGTQTWYSGIPRSIDDPSTGFVNLGTGSKYDPQSRGKDYQSDFNYYIPSSCVGCGYWLSVNRPASIYTDGIKPGWNTRFTFNLRAPQAPGVYREYVTPVVEGVTWMKDIGIYWEIKVLDSNDIPYSNQLLNREEINGVNVLTPTNNDAVISNRSITTYKLKKGDRLVLNVPYYISSLKYDNSILKYTRNTDDVTYTFDVIKDGYSKIEFESPDPYGNIIWYTCVNIVADRNYYFYDKGSNPHSSLNNIKAGDIVIVRLPNPGDGGYVFGDPEFSLSDRVRMLDHTHFAATTGLVGDFGEDQWAFEILDSENANWIQIISYRPWEYQKYNPSTYNTVFTLSWHNL
ncbi:MAG TPA: protease inhibitor I42 family protein [Patescibacteria group bacterium]|nr:protease inhibitor I42 family protein [Patescibacteria group bacterium]